ncbi:hypothetical protein [Streptomyces inhibens]|uniref:hypothetical protein n=1 Tax=Streptomyces inhibens TaxID=2293571 RepID=UPI001EE6D11B|nr:hypothetical protein [Streptomyces inhibens]UKY54025.1 hypothetical protein KI385_37960 [Streptomyces inhibens]
MTPFPGWLRRARNEQYASEKPVSATDGFGAQASAADDSVAAGGDVGTVVHGDNNDVNVYLMQPSPAHDSKFPETSGIVCRPISDCHAIDLEVRPAPKGDVATADLPNYVAREHDTYLEKVVAVAKGGRSQMCVLVGESSTGKTRACWEAIQPLADDGWMVWHPIDPTRAEAALAGLASVRPRTVVWLNEAQHYLMAREIGERIIAALRTLLGDLERAPVLVVGTLWRQHWNALTALPSQHSDPYAQARELLTGRQLRVADAFTQQDLATATRAASTDDRLALALSQARDGRITQFLAGAPELVGRYENAPPAARAVLDVAVDAIRLGCGAHLPHSFLEQAAAGYMPEDIFDGAEDDWFEQSLAYAAQPVHGNIVPLRRVRMRPGRLAPDEPVYQLADYLQQYGGEQRRYLCPPESFWDAAVRLLTNIGDLKALELAAESRWRLHRAHLLSVTAASFGPETVSSTWDARSAIPYPRHLSPEDLDRPEDHFNCRALADLALTHESNAERGEATALAFQAADCCQPDALATLALIRERAGNRSDSAYLAHHAAARGAPYCLSELALAREEAGLYEEAEHYAWEAAQYGLPETLAALAQVREEAGALGQAERLWELAAERDHPEALANIARLRLIDGDHYGAESVAMEAVNRGFAAPWRHTTQPLWATLWPHGIEPDGSPTAPWRTD